MQPRLPAILGPDPAAIHLDDGARDRKAEAGALLLGRHERFEISLSLCSGMPTPLSSTAISTSLSVT